MFLINSISIGLIYPEYRRFLDGLNEPSLVQRNILREIITKNMDTEFGERYGFHNINSIEDFRKKVPLMGYEDFLPYVNKIKRGEQNILTSERVRMLEPTAGSASDSKLIPYTDGLKREFQRGIYPWITDLYIRSPNLLKGKAYWAITPPGTQCYIKECEVPVGFQEDTEYLGKIGKLINKSLVVPTIVGRVTDMERFFYLTSLFLLRERALVLISIWNPTFLTTIIEKIWRCWDELLNEIKTGGSPEKNFQKLKPLPSREKELRESKDNSGINFSNIWKKLRVVSCWVDGPAGMFVHKVREIFPGVEIQGKGLLATEGIVSFPLTGYEGSVLSIRSHFLEFVDKRNGEIIGVGGLERGGYYSVVITTSGGLYRYRLWDIIEVVGKIRSLPLIKFCGKEDFISDYFGEKLNEYFVRIVAENALKKVNIIPDFLLFAPSERNKFHYILFLQTKGKISKKTIILLGNLIEDGLDENFQYQYARMINQIGKVEVRVLKKQSAPLDSFMKFLAKQGRKLGIVKPFMFYNKTGVEEFFYYN